MRVHRFSQQNLNTFPPPLHSNTIFKTEHVFWRFGIIRQGPTHRGRQAWGWRGAHPEQLRRSAPVPAHRGRQARGWRGPQKCVIKNPPGTDLKRAGQRIRF
jgi:hypothetical protein